ncbi:MAG: hypothetical protein JXA18_10745 [Chitinispirillaceae bacterium]|nr:hypothetical protein [Chitinispirillaceae bacterium]
MRIAITATVSTVITAVLVFFIMNNRLNHAKSAADLERLHFAEQTVQKRLNDLSVRIESRLKAFADVVASNNNFSLRLLVENDRSSPVVTETASQFLKPMGFSVLEITDSSRSILSSGHFPASAGNRSVHTDGHLSGEAAATMENIMGTPTLALQAETDFSIAGFPFHATGGLAIDNGLLARLAPNDNVALLLKKGGDYIGMDNIHSISSITDRHIIINDKKYPASEIEIPSTGIDEKVSLIVLLKKRSRPPLRYEKGPPAGGP